ncbi:delta-60 repeat domain-containing protein, partial [Arthrospira platensis SPKY2]
TVFSNILKLNRDGTIDTKFNAGTGAVGGRINAIAKLPDGKFVVGGDFTTFDSNSSIRIARLNSDGSFDSSFSSGTGFDNTVQIVRVDSTGRILVGGLFLNYNSNSSSRLARLSSDGAFDSSFNSNIGTGPNNNVFA